MDPTAYLAEERVAVDATLDRLLPAAERWPQRLHEAMRYAVFGGGKRLRPVLARAACSAAGGKTVAIDEAAAALELIHTYSLVHDDLPAMDDDTLRRGRATVHVAFDEATAILVGDGLLTLGMEVLALYPTGAENAVRRAEACALVARAVGSFGMVGGQMADLEGEGQPHDPARLEAIHAAKTGALIAASVELGALHAEADPARREAYAAFGRDLGLAFQIADDILDVTGTAAELGKSPGKDAQAGKLTFPAVYGLDGARKLLADLDARLTETARRLSGGDDALVMLVAAITRRSR